MEVAGVLLGGVPLVLWALDNYMKAWNPAKDYWRWGSTIATIRMNIFLQQQQLDVTFSNLGLPPNATKSEVESILQRQYPSKHAAFMEIIGEMERIVNQLMKSLDIANWGNSILGQAVFAHRKLLSKLWLAMR